MVTEDMDTLLLIIAGIIVALVLASFAIKRVMGKSESRPEVRIHFDQYKGREQSGR